MASAFPFEDDTPFELKVKSLADDELLEIWVESQQVESLICASLPPGAVLYPDYERAIVNELSLRAGRRLKDAAPRR